MFEDANLGRGESAGKMGLWVGVGLSQAASGDRWLCLAMKQRKWWHSRGRACVDCKWPRLLLSALLHLDI